MSASETPTLTTPSLSFLPSRVQEGEHLRLAVARIAAAKPDVLLVEKTVARYAQEELLSRDISLVIGVKAACLERLARLTEGKVRLLMSCSCSVPFVLGLADAGTSASTTGRCGGRQRCRWCCFTVHFMLYALAAAMQP